AIIVVVYSSIRDFGVVCIIIGIAIIAISLLSLHDALPIFYIQCTVRRCGIAVIIYAIVGNLCGSGMDSRIAVVAISGNFNISSEIGRASCRESVDIVDAIIRDVDVACINVGLGYNRIATCV